MEPTMGFGKKLDNNIHNQDSGFSEGSFGPDCEQFGDLCIDNDEMKDEQQENVVFGNLLEASNKQIKIDEFPLNSPKSFIPKTTTGIIFEDETCKSNNTGRFMGGHMDYQSASASQDADGDTFLMVVIANIVEHLRSALSMISVSTPVQLNTQNKHGQTAAHVAACVGSKDCLRKLIDHGADLRIVDKYGKTPLHIIAERGNAECVLEMFRETPHTDMNVKRMLVKQLYMYDYQGYTPVHHAVVNRQTSTVKAFCRIKASMCVKVATNGYAAIHLAVEQNNEDMAELLITEGKADVNAKSFGGVTPLHLAAGHNNLGMVGLLLILKADPFSKTSENSLPVDFSQNDMIIETLRNLQRSS